MAKETKIEWCDATFNPWIGCTKVSPACDHCYAAVSTPARTLGVEWGAGNPRRRTSAGNWSLPLRWNEKHAEFFAEHGRRRRVFCASLADVFDNEVPPQWRAELFALIEATPNLDWLLLTKRIGNVRDMAPLPWIGGPVQHGPDPSNIHGGWPPNVWLGATICNQAEADRDIPKLLRVPAAVRFLSIEPMLGPIDLHQVYGVPHNAPFSVLNDKNMLGLRRCVEHAVGYCMSDCIGRLPALDWVIAGGESGPHARRMHPDWARALRDQCAAAGVPFLFKQWGEWLPVVADGDWPITACDGTDRTFPGTTKCMIFENHDFAHVGKKTAGRMLDGREHSEWPTPRSFQ